MRLFGFGKKKKESKPCCCSCGCTPGEEQSQGCCTKSAESITSVKVLGAGCKSCHTQYENTQEAVKNLGLDIEVEYITDMQKIMEYGVMSMPAIVVNDKVVCAGKVLNALEVQKLLDKPE